MDNGTSHNCKKINGHRKIVAYRYFAHTFAGYAADVTFGHGTHVAGTIETSEKDRLKKLLFRATRGKALTFFQDIVNP